MAGQRLAWATGPSTVGARASSTESPDGAKTGIGMTAGGMTIVPRAQTSPLEWVLAGSSLVCPRCRHAGEGGMVEAALEVGPVFTKEGEEILDGTLACVNGACGAIYPVVGGVPIIVRDMTGWWRSQRAAVSAV